MRGAEPPAVIVAPGTWAIDRDHSSVEFVSRHLIGRVKGRFARFNGVIRIDADDARSSIDVTIDATSIDTGHPQRDLHLRSADFLHVERFPTLSYRSTSLGALDAAGWFRLEGSLTIRDVTRPVMLEAEYRGSVHDPGGARRCAFSAMTTINRHDFGVRWNDILDSGGIVLGNEIDIGLEVQAILREERRER